MRKHYKYCPPTQQHRDKKIDTPPINYYATSNCSLFMENTTTPETTSFIPTQNTTPPKQKIKAIYFILLPLVIGIAGILLFVYFVYSDRQQKQKNYSAILMKYCTVRKECTWTNDQCTCTKSTLEPVSGIPSVPPQTISRMPTPTSTPSPTALPIATLSATPIATTTPTIVAQTPTPTSQVVVIPLVSPTATPSATPTPTATPKGTLSMAVLGESVIRKGLLFTLLDLLFRKNF